MRRETGATHPNHEDITISSHIQDVPAHHTGVFPSEVDAIPVWVVLGFGGVKMLRVVAGACLMGMFGL